MKLRQSSLDLYAFISIYGKLIEGSFIKKIYETAKGEFIFQIYRSDAGKRELFISLTKGFAFREIVKPEQPTPLTMTLRRLLSERKIISVRQINFDRVVEFDLSNGSSIIFELFREGNLIVTEEGKITYAIIQREWRNRKIKTGEAYHPPGNVDPTNLDDESFAKLVHESRASIVQTIATRFNLGGEYAEELLFRGHLNKNENSSEFKDIGKVQEIFHEMLVESCGNQGYLYDHGNIVSPVKLNYLGQDPERTFADLNEAFSYYFENYPETKETATPMMRRAESQKKTIQEYTRSSEESRKLGQLIMANLERLQDLLTYIRKNEKNVYPGSEILGQKIESIDRGKKDVTVIFQDLQLTMRYDMKASENANAYFSRAKDLLARVEGARKALEESLKNMEPEDSKMEKKRTQKYWFESYNWFFSSENFLVIAGKDRKTNERIVKKHMGPKDLYVHADLYGAPSTIIKSEDDRKPGDVTIREACQFAVAHSRAWNAGLASGSAYWVFPEQVSKTPESGEYVSPGSWIVRGKRNYLFDLPLSLDLSMFHYRNDMMVMCYPSREHKDPDDIYVTVKPGDEKRPSAVKKIAGALGVEREDIDPLLPGGAFSIEIHGERKIRQEIA